MVTRLSEVLCTKFNFSDMFLSVQILANLHNGVKIMALAINFNSFFMFACLDIKICSLFPIITVTFELGLLYKDQWVK